MTERRHEWTDPEEGGLEFCRGTDGRFFYRQATPSEEEWEWNHTDRLPESYVRWLLDTAEAAEAREGSEAPRLPRGRVTRWHSRVPPCCSSAARHTAMAA